jgi:hypothetical protein
MADTLTPRPRRRTMLLLLGVLLLGVVAAAWGVWSRTRERHGRHIGWQHWRPASRPAPAAIPGSAAADPVAASCTAASPEPGPRRVPDNPPGAGGRGRADAHAEAGPRCRARGRHARAARVRCRAAGAT